MIFRIAGRMLPACASYENIALRPIVLCGRLFAFFFMSVAPEEKEVFFKKRVDNIGGCLYNSRAFLPDVHYGRSVGSYGGVAQLARAFGSYPTGHRFESHRRYQIWPLGQVVKTSPFHGGDTSSTLVGVTTQKR